ncbi:MAG TPA: creatininase family protein [Planctomycetota bacterium]|nr:creatininase family protein [Planctomycetota bacterium]
MNYSSILCALLLLGASSCTTTSRPSPAASAHRGVLLQQLTWIEAEKALRPETVVVIPLGAASKEHGPHLLLENDLLLANYLQERVLAAADVVVAPTINYSYYPTLVEYPGTTYLRLETARDIVIDVCTSLARYGPRRFYVLNTGVSTRIPLKAAEEELAKLGILMRWTNVSEVLAPIVKEVAQQTVGSHADEIETSLMLVCAPETVDMPNAVCDGQEKRGTGLTRDPGNTSATYSPTGVFGDARLATREKGERVWEHWVASVLREIEALRDATPPQAP